MHSFPNNLRVRRAHAAFLLNTFSAQSDARCRLRRNGLGRIRARLFFGFGFFHGLNFIAVCDFLQFELQIVRFGVKLSAV